MSNLPHEQKRELYNKGWWESDVPPAHKLYYDPTHSDKPPEWANEEWWIKFIDAHGRWFPTGEKRTPFPSFGFAVYEHIETGAVRREALVL